MSDDELRKAQDLAFQMAENAARRIEANGGRYVPGLREAPLRALAAERDALRADLAAARAEVEALRALVEKAAPHMEWLLYHSAKKTDDVFALTEWARTAETALNQAPAQMNPPGEKPE